VADVPRVLLHQVEQDPLKRGRGLARPPLARLADVGQVVRGDDRRAHGGLHVEVGEQGLQRLGRPDIPALVPPVGPRVLDVSARETPLQPAPLHVTQVLEQLERSPAGRQPA
jgi:hypothetical protein